MKKEKKKKKFKKKVSYPCWSESETHWYLLTEHSQYGAWSKGKWFSKLKYDLKETKEKGIGLLTLK